MRYIMEHTQVPVPFVRNWNSSLNGPANAEYMIMTKVDLPFPIYFKRLTLFRCPAAPLPRCGT